MTAQEYREMHCRLIYDSPVTETQQSCNYDPSVLPEICALLRSAGVGTVQGSNKAVQ